MGKPGQTWANRRHTVDIHWLLESFPQRRVFSSLPLGTKGASLSAWKELLAVPAIRLQCRQIPATQTGTGSNKIELLKNFLNIRNILFISEISEIHISSILWEHPGTGLCENRRGSEQTEPEHQLGAVLLPYLRTMPSIVEIFLTKDESHCFLALPGFQIIAKKVQKDVLEQEKWEKQAAVLFFGLEHEQTLSKAAACRPALGGQCEPSVHGSGAIPLSSICIPESFWIFQLF